MELGYTKATTKSYEEAIASVEQATEANGFKVINRIDMGGILKSKGFEREPIMVLEICHAPSASTVLKQNIDMGLLLPCKVNVYSRNGEMFISALDPSMMKSFFQEPEIQAIADQVEKTVKAIVDAAV